MQQDAHGTGEASAESAHHMKQKNKKAQLVDPSSIFNFSPQVTNWADEADVVQAQTADINALRAKMPAAPIVCRQEEMEQRAPHQPPFQCRLSNVPFEANEDHIRNFLSGCSIKHIHSLERGQSIVEFHDRQSLLLSFKQTNRVMISRQVRVDLYEQRQRNFYDNTGGGGGRRSYDHRGGRGGYNNQHGHDQGQGFNRRQSTGYYNRDREGGGNFYQPYGGNNQGESNTYQNFNSGYRKGPPALQLASKASEHPSPLPGIVAGHSSHTTSSAEAHNKRYDEDALKNLLKSAGNESIRKEDNKHNPFGAARPVDTFAKEREMEKRLEAEQKQRTKRSNDVVSPGQPERQRQSSTSSGGQQYPEQPQAWSQQQQQQQQAEGSYDYQQQTTVWSRQQVEPKQQSYDRSGLEKIGRSRSGNTYQSQQHPAQLQQQPDNGNERQIQDQQVPQQLQEKNMVPAPLPNDNPWNKQKPAAATVSAKTKMVTENQEDQQQYFQAAAYQDVGDQYNSEIANNPYREDEDEKPLQRSRAAPPKAPAWGGAGVAHQQASVPAPAPTVSAWNRPQQSTAAQQLSQDQSHLTRHQQQDNRRSYPPQNQPQQQQQKGSRGRQSYYQASDHVQGNEFNGDSSGEYARRGRGANSGYRAGRGGRGGQRGYRGNYEQEEYQQRRGGGYQQQKSRTNRNSGTDNDEQYERKRYTSTSSSQHRERGDSQVFDQSHEQEEPGWDLVAGKSKQSRGDARGPGAGNQRGKPRSALADNRQNRDGRTFYSRESGGRRSGGGGGGSSGRGGGVGGGSSGRGGRGFSQQSTERRGQQSDRQSVRSTGQRNQQFTEQRSKAKEDFEPVKNKKTTRPIAREAAVPDTTEGERFLDTNKFNLLEEPQNTGQKSAKKGTSNKPVAETSHFEDEDVEEECEYEEVVVEEEVEVEEEEEEQEVKTNDGTAQSPSESHYYDAAAAEGH